jgi:hypothetical protein
MAQTEAADKDGDKCQTNSIMHLLLCCFVALVAFVAFVACDKWDIAFVACMHASKKNLFDSTV